MTRAFPPLSCVKVFYGKILETTYLGFSCVEFRVSHIWIFYVGLFLSLSLFFRLIDSFVSTHKISFSLVKRLVFCASFCCLSWERDISKEKKKKIHERTH